MVIEQPRSQRVQARRLFIVQDLELRARVPKFALRPGGLDPDERLIIER